MKREKIIEVNSPSDQNHKRKIAKRKSMPIVRCVCGYEILVMPDLKAMNFAINHHIAEHKRAGDGAEGLTQFLTKQVLKVASKTNLKNASSRHNASRKSRFSKVTELEGFQ